MSTGEIIGFSFGAAILVCIVVLVILVIYRRRSHLKSTESVPFSFDNVNYSSDATDIPAPENDTA